MEVFLVIVAIIALVAVYFLFLKKGEEPRLPARERQALPPQKERARERPAKKEPAKEAARAGAEAEAREEEEEEWLEAPPEAEVSVPPPPPSRVRRALRAPADVEGMRRGLARSREESGIFGKLKALFAGKKEIGPEISAQIEEVLLASDVGVKTTEALLERVRETLSGSDLVDADKVWDALRAEVLRILEVGGKVGPLTLRVKPTVVLMIGVNGAGKTTTIGKLATKLKEEGLSCVLAAGDTFRAAAVQQLTVWGRRVGCEVVRGKDGADPGSVVFDAIKKAQETGADVVLADTAGRLHTKSNLMAEMEKIARTAGKAMEGAPHETLLVIDATNGQNALQQAGEFKQALELSGIVLTKLDGTAKGGVILGISDTLGLPVRFVGLGERPDDLHEFSPTDFVEALLGREEAGNA